MSASWRTCCAICAVEAAGCSRRQERVYASHGSGHLREAEFSYARLEFAGDYYGRYDGINFSLQICEECAIRIYRSSRAVRPDHCELLGSPES